MSKRPSFQFYPADWRNDPGLRLCSVAARGLWTDMLCLMHEGEPYGFLTHLGRTITPEMLARLVGESDAIVRKLLSQLRENDVFSENDGVIFSRRMVRDEDIREARAKGGPLGAAHGQKGAQHGVKGGRPRKEKPPLSDIQRGVSNPPPSSSSSSPSPSPPSVEEEEERDRAFRRGDLVALSNAISDATGFLLDPSKRLWEEQAIMMRRWLDLGIAPAEIVEVIRERVAASPNPIVSIKYFDSAVRQTIARREPANGTSGPHARSRSARPPTVPDRAREMDEAVERLLGSGAAPA